MPAAASRSSSLIDLENRCLCENSHMPAYAMANLMKKICAGLKCASSFIVEMKVSPQTATMETARMLYIMSDSLLIPKIGREYT